MNKVSPNFLKKSRGKINDQIVDHPFTEYWDVFVLKHQHPINIVFHLIGILFFYGWLLCV